MKTVFYTNCQAGPLKFLLSTSPQFSQSEFFHAANYQLINGQTELPAQLFDCDCFIYQPVDARHGKYSTRADGEIMGRLRSGCLKIGFPCIYCDGLWPVYEEGGKYVGGEAVDKLGPDAGRLYDQGLIDFKLPQRVEASLAYMAERESGCAVKVADFIRKNLTARRLFDTQNHPLGAVFVHVFNQIMGLVGGTPSDFGGRWDDLRMCADVRWPLPAYSIKTLGLWQPEEDPGATQHYRELCVQLADGLLRSKPKNPELFAEREPDPPVVRITPPVPPPPRRAPAKSRRILLACCDAGLANRIGNYAGCARLAEETGRQLLVHWPTNAHLGVPADRLFLTPLPIAGPRVEEVFLPQASVKVYSAFHPDDPWADNDLRVARDDPHAIVVVKSWVTPRFAGEDDSVAAASAWRFAAGLVPVPGVTALSAVTGPIVGLHVRRPDQGQGVGSSGTARRFLDSADAPAFSLDGVGMSQRFLESTDAAFMRAARAAAKAGNRLFLATQSAEFEAKFLAEFPTALVHPKTSSGWAAREVGMLEAMADFYTLANCDSVIGTRWSSFGRVAAWIGNKPYSEV